MSVPLGLVQQGEAIEEAEAESEAEAEAETEVEESRLCTVFVRGQN